MNALDLFSGIGGNSLGLQGYIRTIAYCEADRHAQAVLLSRMSEGKISRAPICTDITQLDGSSFRGSVDIIIAGFPCQDISCAGKGAGLEGKRSGLFFEVVRLAKEIKPTFLFLENVPAIRKRGLDRVIEELTAIGYDLRWTMLAASEVGAPHKRERWFCLASHSECISLWNEQRRCGGEGRQIEAKSGNNGPTWSLANADGVDGNHGGHGAGEIFEPESPVLSRCKINDGIWNSEPDMGRVADGVPLRVDRIKRLGNAVVPAQARKAFEMLMMGVA